MNDDVLEIGGKKIQSRLFVGTGKFPSKEIVRTSLEAAESEVVTVALRRVEENKANENILDHIPDNCILMPNTSGARTADEAVRIARIARAAGCGDWIKIEVIKDSKYLLPDNIATVKATSILADEGFKVFPYMSPDLYCARDLVKAGAAAVMPLGAPIGTNKGLTTKEIVKILINEIDLPVIVDAGIGLPSHAAECMEIGCDAVLVNTAIAVAKDPVLMAKAFANAVIAGRAAFLAGAVTAKTSFAKASSPLTGFLR